MKRIDRICGEARLLRIRRALVARAALTPGGSPIDPETAFWPEIEAAGRLLSDLSEERVGAPRRGGSPVPAEPGPPVFDPVVLGPFVDLVQQAIEGAVSRSRPQDAVFASLWPRVCAAVGCGPKAASAVPALPGSGSSDPAPPGGASPAKPPVDGNRARRSAVEDVSMLAVEMALFEALRRVMRDNDLRRRTSDRHDLAAIVVEDGRVRRRMPRVARVSKGRLNAARSFGLKLPEVEPRRTPAQAFEDHLDALKRDIGTLAASVAEDTDVGDGPGAVTVPGVVDGADPARGDSGSDEEVAA